MTPIALMKTTLLAIVAGALLQRLIPAGAFLGALIAVMAVNVIGKTEVNLPPGSSFVAYVLLGMVVGNTITAESIEAVRQWIPQVIVISVVLLVVGGLIAVILIRQGVDPATAFLASAPGGLTQMTALGTEIGANVALITVAHVVRVVAVFLLAPFVVRAVGG